MASPIVGKWMEKNSENLSEFYQAIGLPDPAPDTEASFEWSQNGDGTWKENFDAGTITIERNFTSGEPSSDGKITTTVDGNVVTETQELGDGNTLNVDRRFSGNTMTTTLKSDKTDIVCTIVFEKL